MTGPSTAIILAAGMGTRLDGVQGGLPKGLLKVGDEPIVARSLRLLRQAGVRRTVIVVGHLEDAYQRFAAAQPDLELVENAAFAGTGTMASLACALAAVRGDFLLLESDIVYERRALEALLAQPEPNVVLGSGPTGAGDEVWLEAPAGRLVAMSKDRGALTSVAGELVGISRISVPLAAALGRCFDDFVAQHHHGRMSYETDALIRVAGEQAIAVHVVPDLLWGEIDDHQHLRRVRDQVLPEIHRREGG
jgi:2-aminoethylphosphonate-pyruvate transaminase